LQICRNTLYVTHFFHCSYRRTVTVQPLTISRNTPWFCCVPVARYGDHFLSQSHHPSHRYYYPQHQMSLICAIWRRYMWMVKTIMINFYVVNLRYYFFFHLTLFSERGLRHIDVAFYILLIFIFGFYTKMKFVNKYSFIYIYLQIYIKYIILQL